MLAKRSNNSLNAKGFNGDMTITIPDIGAGLPERKPSQL
jgi:hypothetical protein